MRSPFVYISRHPYRRTQTVCDGVVSLLTVPAGGWMIRTQQQRTCSSPGWSINQAIPFQETSAFYSSPHTPALSLRFTRFSFPSSPPSTRSSSFQSGIELSARAFSLSLCTVPLSASVPHPPESWKVEFSSACFASNFPQFHICSVRDRNRIESQFLRVYKSLSVVWLAQSFLGKVVKIRKKQRPDSTVKGYAKPIITAYREDPLQLEYSQTVCVIECRKVCRLLHAKHSFGGTTNIEERRRPTTLTLRVSRKQERFSARRPSESVGKSHSVLSSSLSGPVLLNTSVIAAETLYIACIIIKFTEQHPCALLKITETTKY